ncbi:MAG TPA: hypothetical protein VFD84_00620, partial [Candidatus Binatia bacterium]|nr:hypothetical protein [Candidatus Binatia bacterium]
MGTIYKRKGSQFWWIKYQVPGEPKPRYESSKSPLREDAEKKLKVVEGDVARGKTLPPVACTVGDLLDAAILAQEQKGNRSIKDSRRNADHLKATFGKRKASDLIGFTDAVRQYRQRCLNQDDKPSTVNRRVSLLKFAFHLAALEGRIGQMPPFPP